MYKTQTGKKARLTCELQRGGKKGTRIRGAEKKRRGYLKVVGVKPAAQG